MSTSNVTTNTTTNQAEFNEAPTRFHTVIIGGGPAGTGPLIYGAASGQLDKWLNKGVALVEKSDVLCSGRLIDYQINSNSTGDQFLDFLSHAHSEAIFTHANAAPEKQTIAAKADNVVSLETVGQFLRAAGKDIEHCVTSNAHSHVFFGQEATQIRQTGSGAFEVSLQADPQVNLQGNRPGQQPQKPQQKHVIQAANVLIAPGGKSVASHRVGRKIADMCATHRTGDKAGTLPMMTHSDVFLTDAGRQSAEMWLEDFDAPKVLIVGGSHSAFSCAWVLLNELDVDFDFDAEQIDILHRAPMKVFYKSKQAAADDGYTHFNENDLCPVTGHVFEIAGLRGDARQLYRELVGFESEQEDRIALHQYDVENDPLSDLDIDWGNIELVIFANGYALPAVTITNPLGKQIPLLGDYTGRFVDEKCRLLDTKGVAIPGLYAMGMATGFLPTRLSTGEPSFSGKDNSVWLCQNDLGALLFNTMSAN